MKYSEQYEQLLKQALSPEVMPDEKLNDKIKELSRRDYVMKRTSKKKAVFVPLIAILALLMSMGAFAAWNLLNPEKVAEEIENDALAKAFESDDAIQINETKVDGGYKITLLGLVSGKGISDFSEEELKARTYAVLAIENEDGSPMPDTSDDEYGKVSFFTSPLVKGIKPWQFNIYFMEGGHTEFVKEDGILYRVIECDSIEMFADRGLELCVIGNSSTYNRDAFVYNEQTGEIAPNEEYEGTNVVFNLPIDEKKADPEAAERYLQEIFADQEAPSEEISEEELTKELEEADRLAEQGKEIPGSLKELKVDEKGYVYYEMESEEYGTYAGEYRLKDLFPDENENVRNEVCSISESQVGNETKRKTMIIQFRRDEQGNMTARAIIVESIAE